MRNMESVLLGSVLALGMAMSHSATAGINDVCSVAQWTGELPVPVATDAAGTPQTPRKVARYSEFCGLEVNTLEYVQSPATSDARYFGRFYVLPQVTGSGEVDLLIAYSDTDGASPLFVISFDGTDFNFDATGTGGGSGSVAAQVTGGGQPMWNLVEFEYNNDGDFNVWVNEDWALPDGPYSSTSIPAFASGDGGSVASVRMGAPTGMGGFGGKITFDAFEAHRTTNVGGLRVGDANADDVVNTGDIGQVINEFFATSLAPGTPDCNEDGVVNTGDIGCIINVFFGN